MKKQILLLTFLSLAFVFAGLNVAFGQAPYITYPETPELIEAALLECAEEATEVNPLPGELYTYTVQTTDVTDDVRWFVINNNDLATATPTADSIINKYGEVLAIGSDYIDPADGTGPYILGLGTSSFVEYNYSTGPTGALDDDGVSATGTGTDHSIEIRWKSFDGNQPNEVLLVAIASDASGCTNNIEVYRIVPTFNFTLDIATLANNGDSISDPNSLPDEIINSCVSPVEYAWYDAVNDISGDGTLTVDYGENWAFFIINASNFVDSWMPRFEISTDLAAGAGTVDITAEWAYASDNFADGGAAEQTWYEIDASGNTTQPVVAGGLDPDDSYNPFNAVGDGVSAAEGGEHIIVRVRLDWGTDAENAVDDVTLTVAVDGVMFDPQEDDTSLLADQFDFANIALKDLGEPADIGDPCVDDNFINDVVDHIITPRPQVISTTGDPDVPFELNTGDPDDPNFGDN